MHLGTRPLLDRNLIITLHDLVRLTADGLDWIKILTNGSRGYLLEIIY
jgi:hypothetical protein